MKSKLYKLGFRPRYLYFITDLIITFGIGFLSFLVYYGLSGIPSHINETLIYCASLSGLLVLTYGFGRVYSMLTMELGIFEVVKMIVLSFLVNVVGIIAIAFIPQLPSAPDFLTTWVLATTSLVFLLPASRAVVRLFFLMRRIQTKTSRVRTIVIGAGSAGKIVVDESRNNRDNHNQVVAFVDDDPNKIGGTFLGLPVKGPISNISTIIDYYKVEEVIIAISDIKEARQHEIISLLNTCPVRVRRLPRLKEMAGPNDVRILDVNINDLLGRDPVELDNSEVFDMLHGQTVMVTGAGGSIGSELTRQIFNTHPKTLILFDIYENSTYDIQMELVRKMRDENITDINLVTLIGSTYNEVRMEQIIREYRPDYIYHAAAYKHVPLMEDSPAEAIRTNVIGTYNVARLADKYGVKKMVLVSTDKAVRPTNVMGATKRFAETIIQYYAGHSKNTKYAAVRFGNVLGSNGSVVPLFKKQIEAGGPVTITDKRITRYFMNIPEAVSLILQCGLFAEGGEIFILDMGQPVMIVHLAEMLIRQAGKQPYKEIPIIEVGLRPGEKLYEELLLDTENQIKTSNKKIFIEPREMTNEKVLEDIEKASVAFGLDETKSDVKSLLAKLINTYRINEKDK